MTFNNEDIQIESAPEGGWICSGCRLSKKKIGIAGMVWYDSIKLNTSSDTEDHLYEHLSAGHIIPDNLLGQFEQSD